jgi:hypothetical protein
MYWGHVSPALGTSMTASEERDVTVLRADSSLTGAPLRCWRANSSRWPTPATLAAVPAMVPWVRRGETGRGGTGGCG